MIKTKHFALYILETFRTPYTVRRTFFYCCLALVVSSCTLLAPPHSIKKNITNCFDGKPTGIEKMIKVDGYYTIKYIRIWKKLVQTRGVQDKHWSFKLGEYVYDDSAFVREIDTLSIYFMFYRDGSYVGDFNYPDADKYLNQVKSDYKEKYWFERSFYWGKYVINADTIKIQCISHPAPLGDTWMAFEYIYKVKNDTTLQFISQESIDSQVEKEREKHKSAYKDTATHIRLEAKFTPTATRPDSANWLKKKKWFHCR